MDIDEALSRAEAALNAGGSLKGTGFWPAVDACRRERSLADTYADRIAVIDRRAFERGVRLRVPAVVGVVALTLASIVGIVLLRYAAGRDNIVTFVIGFGALLIGTHSLTHWFIGRLFGIRFTHVFLGGPPPPRPGVKTDYATYLRATPDQRAAMHASGAIVTKLIPFVLLPFAWAPWLRWALIAVGIVQIITDVTLSTKSSDWKKVKRELS